MLHPCKTSKPLVALCVALSTIIMAACTPATAKDRVRVVGSSTVYPFATAVAEKAALNNAQLRTPVIEATGTGGGIKLFCTGTADNAPDIVNASRPMTADELATCKQNGVHSITQVPIGYDGIVLLTAKSTAPLKLTRDQLYRALAAQVLQQPVNKENPVFVANPNKNWSDVDKSLPNTPIEVMGPPATSGTHDSLSELIVEHTCKANLSDAALLRNKANCRLLRTDSAWIDGSENDNLLLQKIATQPQLVGVVGYNYLLQNRDKVQPVAIDNVLPTTQTMAVDATGHAAGGQHYPLARAIYFYIKVQSLGVAPGLQEYVTEFVSTKAIGAQGYLVRKGLIPLGEEQLKQAQADVASFKILPLTPVVKSSVQ